MKQKYSIIGLFLIALTACGAKTIENKHKQQRVVAEKIEDSSVSAEHHANKTPYLLILILILKQTAHWFVVSYKI